MRLRTVPGREKSAGIPDEPSALPGRDGSPGADLVFRTVILCAKGQMDRGRCKIVLRNFCIRCTPGYQKSLCTILQQPLFRLTEISYPMRKQFGDIQFKQPVGTEAEANELPQLQSAEG